MQGKTCIVTGASNGIGLETAVALAGMGATVAMVARDRTRGEAAVAEVNRRSGSATAHLLLADLASLDDIRRLAGEVRATYPRIDVLVNNAGAYNATRSETRDGFETTFGVNHLAYFLLTNLLLDVIKASAPARIVNVSSTAHVRAKLDFDDLQSEKNYAGFQTYGRSKLANVLFTYELARRLEGTGVTANCLHPGVVRTGFGKNNSGATRVFFNIFQAVGKPFLLSPAKGAATTIYLASSPEVEGVTGKYFANSREKNSNDASHDLESARRLWEMSEAMVGLAASPVA
jgi:NAD(P)-dependent dehydrogenase (short-subunit alcohol dehydrogenase family)